MLTASRAQGLDKRCFEDVGETTADGGGTRYAVERLERGIPTHDALLCVEHDEPVVERLQNVVVELAHPAELLGLEVQLTVEPPVLDGCGHLSRHGCEQGQILAVERLVVLFAAQREDG